MSTQLVVAILAAWVGFVPLTPAATGSRARATGESTATIPPIGVAAEQAPPLTLEDPETTRLAPP